MVVPLNLQHMLLQSIALHSFVCVSLPSITACRIQPPSVDRVDRVDRVDGCITVCI